MISHICLYLCISLVIHSLMAHVAIGQPNLTTDATSLLALSTSITSDFLIQNWTLGSSVCNWYGVTCASRHKRVVALNISNMALRGIIPPHIGNLSFLSVLDLHGNAFSGNLPPETVRLRRLKIVDLSFNEFSVEIPSWIGAFPRLNYLSLANNSFTGALPTSLFNLSMLETFDARFNQLQGSIPPNIGNLQSLRFLNLMFNQLTGTVPTSLFNISSLETIDLTSNRLTGNLSGEAICRNLPRLRELLLPNNQFYGRILSGLHQCSQLRELSVYYNMFTGPIPREIGNLVLLRTAFLSYNTWTGEIPPEIGNMSSLEELQIQNASLTGAIPSEVARLPRLLQLTFDLNSLRGPIPVSVFNMSTLVRISLSFNNVSGSLPSNCNLPNLEYLFLGSNALTGTIPDCISNSSRLVSLDLSINYFTGLIPTSLGNLRFLNRLNLATNNLTTDPSTGLSFISSLTNCINLRTLGISFNPLNGNLPSSMGNFSSLQNLYLQNSGITGRIPDEVGNLSTAILISLGNNDLRGPIPTTFKNFHSLSLLELASNQLQGPIHEGICEMKNLFLLYLFDNRFTGPMPACLANVTTLQYLHLASNMLSSNIPENLFSLQLRELNLSDNSFTGKIPQNIGNLEAATVIDLGMNQLSGTIPTALSSLRSLTNFSLFHNQLEGSIPDSLGRVLALEYLDLSHNNLAGFVPKSLEALVYMVYFNVSFNRLIGQIPNGGPFRNFTFESFMSNEALCGAPWFQLPTCPHESLKTRLPLAVIIILPIIAAILCLVTAFMLTKYFRRKRNQIVEDQSPPIAIGYERISYHELQLATNGFSESNLLATGGFGSVYAGKLSDGTVVAVKVYNLQRESSLKSFDTESRVLSTLRHRNLIKIISSCSNLNFRALVLEFMPNGSLERWLYSHNNFLDILKRLDIMIDVAAAMEYLHHGYSTPIIHCDLKPSNVLLDENMTGYVTDFGLSKLFGLGEFIAQTRTIATIGYIAPEYGSKGLVSMNSDVYSYGIMAMEVFSRKRPTDEMFGGDLSIKSWIAELYPVEIIRVVDENLIPPNAEYLKHRLQCLTSIMEVALMCCEEVPEERINMIDTLASLKKIRMKYHKVLS